MFSFEVMPLASRILMAGLMGALAGCAGLPAGVERQPSSAYSDTGSTRLGRAFAGAVAAHPGKTGVLPLPSGREAFAARIITARTAERSIDAQYYIWHGDTTGTLLFEAMWNAAERGFASDCSSTIRTPAASTRRSPRSTRTPTSKCGCSTRTSPGPSAPPTT